MVCIPLWIVYKMSTAKGSLREVSVAFWDIVCYGYCILQQVHTVQYGCMLYQTSPLFSSSAFPRAHHALAGPAQDETRTGETSGHFCCWRRDYSPAKRPNQRRVLPRQRERVALLALCFPEGGASKPSHDTSHSTGSQISITTCQDDARPRRPVRGFEERLLILCLLSLLRGFEKPVSVNIIDSRMLKNTVCNLFYFCNHTYFKVKHDF